MRLPVDVVGLVEDGPACILCPVVDAVFGIEFDEVIDLEVGDLGLEVAAGGGGLGAGLGKANEVPEAIRKGTEQAKKHIFKIPLDKHTIPHEVLGRFGAGKVLLKPASQGTGVIAGGAVRNLVEVAGIQDILTKCIGTSNPHNVIHATVQALQQLRSAEEALRARGKTLESLSQ